MWKIWSRPSSQIHQTLIDRGRHEASFTLASFPWQVPLSRKTCWLYALASSPWQVFLGNVNGKYDKFSLTSNLHQQISPLTSFSLTSVLAQKLACKFLNKGTCQEKLVIFFHLHCQGKLASVNEALMENIVGFSVNPISFVFFSRQFEPIGHFFMYLDTWCTLI